jgi:hypothetical protein
MKTTQKDLITHETNRNELEIALEEKVEQLRNEIHSLKTNPIVEFTTCIKPIIFMKKVMWYEIHITKYTEAGELSGFAAALILSKLDELGFLLCTQLNNGGIIVSIEK